MTTCNLLGHRGIKAKILENSEQGFAYAHSLIAHGLDGIEFDIQLTADDELLVTHDDTLNRLCRRQGNVEQLSAHSCKQIFQQATGHSLVSLSEMVPYLRGFQHIELEIKTHHRMSNQKLVKRLQQVYVTASLQSLPIVFTSFDIDILNKLQASQQLTGIPRGMLVEEDFTTDSLIDTALRLQCCQVGINQQLITPKIVQLCHRYGLAVTAWTVNDADRAEELLLMGVDTIISDCPNTLGIR